jgi:hypothetical protein
VANVLDELATRIATTVSGTVGTNIFKSEIPAGVADASIGLIETGGLPPEKRFGTKGIDWERPSVQFLVRGAPGGYETARATSQTIFEDMAKIETEDLSGTRYYLSDPQQEPFGLKVDEHDRPILAFNVIFTKDIS